MTESRQLFKVTNLGRKLAQRWLWRGVSFELLAGHCLGLVAPSGAGKTLLLRNLVLLDPIDEGEVCFESRPLSHTPLPAYRTQVIYLPQQPAYFEGTVADNLKHVFKFAINSHRRYNPLQIEDWLTQLGRSYDFINQQTVQLSGGEAQILALVRALQLEPTILLLDEPTASLDAKTTAQVEALLKNWLHDRDRACILTSHDSAQIDRVTHWQLPLEKYLQ